MTFSRGAWVLFAFVSALYICFFFLTARDNQQRIKTIVLCLLSLIAFVGIVVVALQSSKVQDLWDQRASLNQSYDVGDQGRFVGHKKAAKIISENPIGIGALYFGYYYHHELPHNLYLSMFFKHRMDWRGAVFILNRSDALFWRGHIIQAKSLDALSWHCILYLCWTCP